MQENREKLLSFVNAFQCRYYYSDVENVKCTFEYKNAIIFYLHNAVIFLDQSYKYYAYDMINFI